MRRDERWRLDSRMDERPAEGIEEGQLRRLLSNTIDTIEDNKTQIFDIYQNTRSEVDDARDRLAELRNRVAETIERVDGLTQEEQRAKQRLAEVSRNFADHTEDEIRKTYEAVSIIQINLAIEREKEQSMRVERDKLEIRLRYLYNVVARAEHMALSIGSVLSYLSTQVSGVLWKIEAVQKDKFVGARIIKATEEERYRISREIHDGPAQDLANVLFTTTIAERLMDQDMAEAKNTLVEMREEIRKCLTSVRQIIFDMRPMALDDLGLPQAVEQLIRLFGERGKLRGTFSLEGAHYTLPKHVEIAIFRIVQEALNNVVHHAKTDKVRVRMHYTDQALTVLIADDGVGFDVNRLPEQTENTDETADALDMETQRRLRGRHFGVIGMEERAKIIGAAIQILSEPGKGTKVHLRVQNRMVEEH
ncbi:histidine kinase [Selenomonas sp. oral taxon 920]|uniref:sensor histidine kinase n=1 Tax=Selenomonas sp. oral taxon 920 TaxID=1884263 RepID=UPI000840E52A|nr:sensor histidine kinase [Selenomonas sp. oral taxon 920]AOH47313.1 histidine kinase [Selenomonas sp. oral taxon 920]